MKKYVKEIYQTRFNQQEKQRIVLWQVLCQDFFQQFIKPTDAVLDLGAGYCEFINNISCKEKYAVDLNPITKKMAHRDVKYYQTLSTKLPRELEKKIDVVFVSNFFEHLDNKEELIATLEQIHKVLKKGGKLLILQPNIRLVGEAYWDFVDHSLALTEKSLKEALELSNFKIIYQKVRFLPYTTRSILPTSKWLIKLYLKLPFIQYFLGKQTFIIAQQYKQ